MSTRPKPPPSKTTAAPATNVTTATIVTAALLSGGRDETFDLRTADGGLVRLPVTRDALTEIAALAAAALMNGSVRERLH